jgi:hypothetical protein
MMMQAAQKMGLTKEIDEQIKTETDPEKIKALGKKKIQIIKKKAEELRVNEITASNVRKAEKKAEELRVNEITASNVRKAEKKAGKKEEEEEEVLITQTTAFTAAAAAVGTPADLSKLQIIKRYAVTFSPSDLVAQGQPEMRRQCSFNPVSRNQLNTEHCFGVSMCDVLISFLVINCHLTSEESELLFTFYLNRVNQNTFVSSAVNMNLLALFLYELNYGFGDSIHYGNIFFVYKIPPNYSTNVDNFGDIRATKGQFQFKKIPFKPFLMSGVMKDLHDRMRECLAMCGGIDWEEFIPDVEVARGSAAQLESTFLYFAKGTKTIVTVTFDDDLFARLQDPDENGIINFPNVSKPVAATFSDSHAMVSYDIVQQRGLNTMLIINSWGINWGVEAVSRHGDKIKGGYFVIDFDSILNNIQTMIKLKCKYSPLSDAGAAAAAAASIGKYGVAGFIDPQHWTEANQTQVNIAAASAAAYRQAYEQVKSQAYAQAITQGQSQAQAAVYAQAQAYAYAQAQAQAVHIGGSKPKPKSRKSKKFQRISKRHNNRRTYKKKARKTKRRRQY